MNNSDRDTIEKYAGINDLEIIPLRRDRTRSVINTDRSVQLLWLLKIRPDGLAILTNKREALNASSDQGLVLCEANIGNSKSVSSLNVTHIPVGWDSCFSAGRWTPDPSGDRLILEDVVCPLGDPVYRPFAEHDWDIYLCSGFTPRYYLKQLATKS